MALVASGWADSTPPPFPTAKGYARGEFERDFFSALLEHYDCNVSQAVAHVMAPSNRRVSNLRREGKDDGGFGAQMCLRVVPRATSAVLIGARLTMDLAGQAWNYGCPGHETAREVLASVLPPDEAGGDDVARSKANDDVCQSGTRFLPDPPTCRGRAVPLGAVRNATADFLFTLQPFFADGVAEAVASLGLPKLGDVLAIHLRGGDKLVRAENARGWVRGGDMTAAAVRGRPTHFFA